MQSVRLLLVLFIALGVMLYYQDVTTTTDSKKKITFVTPTPTLSKTPPLPDKKADLSSRGTGAILPSPTVSMNNTSFIYPNGKEVGVNTYESTDDSDMITSWYSERIKSSGMNTTSFVKTKNNNSVFNKLVGANENGSITVEIKKDAGETMTKIVVTQE